MIKEAMGLRGPNSYQESKALWEELEAAERRTYTTNVETQVVALLKSNQDGRLVLFTA